MKGLQLFPFERNRYYYGKMLTSADFTAEQDYLNHKRMFMNQMMLGSGVVCGLGVLNLDDLSILVESGLAVDPLGREIVVETSAVKKLSALEGYDSCTGDRLSLCLRYKEEETRPVYAVNRKEDQSEYENNRITEGYELFLADAASAEEHFRLDSEFFVEAWLLDTKDNKVCLRLPANACKGRKLKLTFAAEKISDKEEPLDLFYILKFPGLVAGDGTRELRIEKRGLKLKKGERASFDYWLYTPYTELEETHIIVGGQGEDQTTLKVMLTEEAPETLIRRELGRPSLEIRGTEEVRDFVRLADLYMVRTDTSYILDRIEEARTKQYIPVPAYEVQRELYSSCYGGEWEPPQKPKEEPYRGGQTMQAAPAYEKLQIADGILEVPLEQNMKRGAVCFSGEVPHGLGAGRVYVTVGTDQREDGVNLKKRVRSTIFGESSLFLSKNPRETCVKTAVKVFEDKGTFQAAVRLEGEQNTVLLPLHFVAVKLPEITEGILLEQMEPMAITPREATVKLSPRERHYFEINFHNMKPCPLRYELLDEEGGTIEEDGTYTAPRKQGVYEIKISCQDHPAIFTYAYAVVNGKARGPAEEE